MPDALVQGPRRHRSPNYPSVSLPIAVDRVRRLYEADRRAGSPLDAAVRHLGFNRPHGTAMTLVSALRKYGLLELANNRVTPTDRAVAIVVYPESDQRRIEAVRAAALAPDVYKELFDRFAVNGTLPSEETFKAELQAEMKFNPKAVTDFVADFKATLLYAGLLDTDGVTLRTDSGGPSMQPTPNQSFTAEPVRPARFLNEPIRADSYSKAYSWALSPNVTAELRINGDDISPDELDMLRDYLEITIKALSRSSTKKAEKREEQ